MQLSFVLLEQPEDLGAMAYGPNAGERPASMRQWPAFADITAKPDWKTFAFHQGNFGAGYPKPTRLLVFAKECFTLPSFCYEGPPSFDDTGLYFGPLPMAKGMGSIRNRQSQGPFKTSGTEMWPGFKRILYTGKPPPTKAFPLISNSISQRIQLKEHHVQNQSSRILLCFLVKFHKKLIKNLS